MDSFFQNFTWGAEDSLDPVPRAKKSCIKVSSLDQLSGFIRVADNFLVNKAKKDLWKIEKGSEGDLLIYRLVDDEGKPVEV